jgi:DMSO/TMAO reductase YedYZ heme-binding membrane subunit
MLAVGLSTTFLSADHRSQLFRLGGWVTVTIGMLTLLRSGEMVDFTGYGALICLMLTLTARPLNRLLPSLLCYRRALGVGAYILSLAHTAHMLDHSFTWNLAAIPFMLPLQQIGIWSGFMALGLMTPAALTSFDAIAEKLGKYWRKIHLLAVPALLLAVSHTILIGSTYLGSLEWTTSHKLLSILLGIVTLVILMLRWRWSWRLV